MYSKFKNKLRKEIYESELTELAFSHWMAWMEEVKVAFIHQLDEDNKI
jgi:hypothetical protein